MCGWALWYIDSDNRCICTVSASAWDCAGVWAMVSVRAWAHPRAGDAPDQRAALWSVACIQFEWNQRAVTDVCQRKRACCYITLTLYLVGGWNVKWVYVRQGGRRGVHGDLMRTASTQCLKHLNIVLCYRKMTRRFWSIKQWLVNYCNIFHSYSCELVGFLSCFYAVLMFWSTVVPSWRLTWWRADDTYLQNHRYIPNDMHSSFNSCSFSAAVAGRRLAGSHLWTTRPNFKHAPHPPSFFFFFLHLFFLFPSVPRSVERWSEASQEIRP